MKTRLTDKLIATLPVMPERNVIYYDAVNAKGNDHVPGFGLRVSKGGAKAFILNYRVAGIERRTTIGSPPSWSLLAARKKAKELRRQIDEGSDPVKQKRDILHAPTMGDLCDRFVAEHVPTRKPSTRPDYRSIAGLIKKELGGSRKVASITTEDAEKLHRKLSKTVPYRANRVLAVMSKMFSLAARWKMREGDNPCRGIQRNVEERRERYISKAELERLLRALAEEPNTRVANIFRMLLWTGARKGEVLSATWKQLDLEVGIWSKPASSTKTSKPHSVPLSGPALVLLRSLRQKQSGDGLVFPGNGAEGKMTQIHLAWQRICKRAQITDLRIHDLRHSYASALASSGHGLPVIGALLGHSNPTTTWRYAHLIQDTQRSATEAAGSILSGKPTAEVVPLKRKKA